MVEMLLKDIKQDADVRAAMYKLQLMRRKLEHNYRLFVNPLDDVEYRNADVSCKNRVFTRLFQKMVNQSWCGAFALCSRHADDLAMKLFEEQISLRRYLW